MDMNVESTWTTIAGVLREGIGKNAAERKKLEAYVVQHDPALRTKKGGFDFVLYDGTGLLQAAAFKTVAEKVLMMINSPTAVLLQVDGFKVRVSQDPAFPHVAINITEDTILTVISKATQENTMVCPIEKIKDIDAGFYRNTFDGLSGKNGNFMMNVRAVVQSLLSTGTTGYDSVLLR